MNKDIFKIKVQSRSDLVVDKITNSILNGDLSDGEMLPPEHQLCELFGVSRSILREAIRILTSKGLVEVKQGHGTFVRFPKIDVPLEAVANYLITNSFSQAQLMEVRTPIEVEVAKLAAERREESHLTDMEASIQIMKDTSISDEGYADADNQFHNAIIDASGNPLFSIMIRSIMGSINFSRQLGIRHFGIEVVIKEHENILESIKQKDPQMAVDSMKNHMNMALSRIVRVNELLNKNKVVDKGLSNPRAIVCLNAQTSQ